MTRISLRKRPQQLRSQVTFESIVTAATRLLSTKGYARLTTNHVAEAAGVGIASLYEYFPGKDAVVSEVGNRLVDRVLEQLAVGVPAIFAGPPAEAVERWIWLIYQTLRAEKRLVAVFVEQVPFVRKLPAVRTLAPRLMALSTTMRLRPGTRPNVDAATLHLLINLVSSTVLELLLDPPDDVSTETMLTALAERVQAWVG